MTQFFTDMRESIIIRNGWVGAVAAHDNALDATAFRGTKERSNIMGRAYIVGKKYDIGHVL